jgi:tetratricopeptide (TPR) repeat protein
VALAREDTETGLACLENIPESGPSAAIRAYLLGKFELLRHRARAAEEALLEALRHDVDFVDAHRALVYLYGMQNRRQALWAQFEALAERGGLSAELVRHWCISHSAVGDPSEIPQDLERFVSADPTDVWSRLSLADAYRQLGKVEQAESALRGLDIANPDVRAVRAALAMSRGEISQAESLLADGPLDHPGLARLRGRLALARRHGAAAVGHFQAADAADPNDGETLVALSQALRLVGDTTQAEAIAQRAQAQQVLRNRLRELEEVPRLTPQNLCELGTRSEAAGFTAEARAWYRLAIAADPLNAEAQRALHRLGPAASTRHASAGTDGAD